MPFGICNVSLSPLRLEPSHRSEQVNQLLFGEYFEILEQRQEWQRVKLSYDSYEGWMSSSQSSALTFEDYQYLSKNETFLSFDLVQLLIVDSMMFSIVMGSNLPFFANSSCTINKIVYKFDGNARCPVRLNDNRIIVENAYMYLNSPYLWGGRSPFGIDCSGLTQMVYKMCGIKLLRDAWQQAEQGYLINLMDETHPGDLAFFDNEEGKITHVGIVLPNHKIIHASGRVRIDSIDHHGIYNGELKRYTHKLRLIKRYT